MSAFLAPIKITTPPKIYRPAPCCIYCGRKGITRSLEHIIAFGLAGDSLKFPKASCKRCREKIHTYETHCMRAMWWPFRTRIGAPSRGKSPPEKFEIRKIKVKGYNNDGTLNYDRAGVERVAPHEFPLIYIWHRFEPPGILTGRDPAQDVKIEIGAFLAKEETKKYHAKDKDGFDMGPGQPDQLLQMLAKIAHGYAVAELGYGAFRPRLAQFIRGLFPFRPYHWIGSELQNPPAAPPLHEIRLHVERIRGVGHVVVTLRLFCFLPTPRYQIVVGELQGSVDEAALLKQAHHTIEIEAAPPLAHLIPVTGAAGV